MNRRGLAVSAAVLVLVGAAGLQAWGPWRRGAVSTNGMNPVAVAQVVSFHGITLVVDGSWAVGTFTCTRPDRSAVRIEDWSGTSCPGFPDHPATPADATVLSLGDLSTRTPQGDPVTVAGKPARRYVHTSSTDGPPVTEWQLPAAGVVVTVTGPGRTDPRVLDGLRYTPVDGNGCAASIAREPIPATMPSGKLALPLPVSITVCDYAPLWSGHGGWLVGSRLLDPATVRTFVDTVNAAPPWVDPSDVYGQLQGDDLFYRFTYADTSTRIIGARAFGAAMAVSDGAHRVAIPDDVGLPTAWTN